MVRPVDNIRGFFSPQQNTRNQPNEPKIKVTIKDCSNGITYSCKGSFPGLIPNNDSSPIGKIRTILEGVIPHIETFRCSATSRKHYIDPYDSKIV